MNTVSSKANGAPRKRVSAPDIPRADEPAIDASAAQIAFNGPPAAFVEALAHIAPRADARSVAAYVIEAWRQANKAEKLRLDLREAARKRLANEAGSLKAERAALAYRRALAEDENAMDLARAFTVVAAWSGAQHADNAPEQNWSAVDYDRMNELDRRIEAVTVALAGSDGRGGSRTRLRDFAEFLGDLYSEITGKAPTTSRAKATTCKDAGGFHAFILASQRLVGGELIASQVESICNEVAKARAVRR